MLTTNHKSVEEAADKLIELGYMEDKGIWHNQDTYPDNKEQYAIAFITYVNDNHYTVIYSDNLTMNY